MIIEISQIIYKKSELIMKNHIQFIIECPEVKIFFSFSVFSDMEIFSKIIVYGLFICNLYKYCIIYRIVIVRNTLFDILKQIYDIDAASLTIIFIGNQ